MSQTNEQKVLVGCGEDSSGATVVTLGLTEAAIAYLGKEGNPTHTVDLAQIGHKFKIIIHRGKDRTALRAQLGDHGRGGGELDLGIKQ